MKERKMAGSEYLCVIILLFAFFGGRGQRAKKDDEQYLS